MSYVDKNPSIMNFYYPGQGNGQKAQICLHLCLYLHDVIRSIKQKKGKAVQGSGGRLPFLMSGEERLQ